MLREKMIKNKRTRIGRILPAAAAAVFAVFGMGSCAALEMLDALAAEEEQYTAHTTVKPKPVQQESESSSVQDEAPAADAEKPGEEAASAQDSTAPAVTASPADISADVQTVGTQVSGQPADGTSAAQPPVSSSDVSAVDLPGVTIGGGAPGSSFTGDSSTGSLLTDIAESGIDPNGSSPDIYTPGGYTPDSDPGTSVQGTQQTQAGTGLPVYLAYTELVDKYAAYTARDPEYKPEYCHYYITDIDNSGIPELLIETGTIETDRTIYVYTFDGGSAELLGNFVAWHTRLGDGDGVIYTETSAMGSYIVSTITIKEGKLFTERGEQPYSETQLKMPLISYSLTDPSALEALR